MRIRIGRSGRRATTPQSIWPKCPLLLGNVAAPDTRHTTGESSVIKSVMFPPTNASIVGAGIGRAHAVLGMEGRGTLMT